jgi:hypothetical protein
VIQRKRLRAKRALADKANIAGRTDPLMQRAKFKKGYDPRYPATMPVSKKGSERFFGSLERWGKRRNAAKKNA